MRLRPLLAFLALLAFVFPTRSFAITRDGGPACAALGGIWHQPICIVGDLTIPVGDNLRIVAGIWLMVGDIGCNPDIDPCELVNHGDIRNFGTIGINGRVTSTGHIENLATIEGPYQNPGPSFAENVGVLTTSGTFNHAASGSFETNYLINSGEADIAGDFWPREEFENSGTANIACGAPGPSPFRASVLTNTGTLTVTGYLQVGGSFLTNEGEFINAGKISLGRGTNTGVIRHEPGSTCSMNYPLDNAGLYENWGWVYIGSGHINNLATGVVENHGDLRWGGITNYGLVINYYRLGEWPDEYGGGWANHGVWKNYYEMQFNTPYPNTGQLVNEGSIIHRAQFDNVGHLVNEDHIHYSRPANNQGRITNRGDSVVGHLAMMVNEPGGLIENSSTIRAVCSNR